MNCILFSSDQPNLFSCFVNDINFIHEEGGRELFYVRMAFQKTNILSIRVGERLSEVKETKTLSKYSIIMCKEKT